MVPNIWHFLYFVGATSRNSLMIPKIYNHVLLTFRMLFNPSRCTQNEIQDLLMANSQVTSCTLCSMDWGHVERFTTDLDLKLYENSGLLTENLFLVLKFCLPETLNSTLGCHPCI